MASKQAVRRINLRLPENLFNELMSIVDERGVTITSQIIEFISDGISNYSIKKQVNEKLQDPVYAGQLLSALGMNQDTIDQLVKGVKNEEI